MDEILTLKEVSKYLRTSRDTIYRMAKRGQIPCFKVGGNWRFKKDRIERWLIAQEGKKRSKRKKG